MSNPYQKFDIHIWQPWQYSTGAKTLEGKANSKMNALKSGNFTKEAIADRKEQAAARRAFRNMGSAELYQLCKKLLENNFE